MFFAFYYCLLLENKPYPFSHFFHFLFGALAGNLSALFDDFQYSSFVFLKLGALFTQWSNERFHIFNQCFFEFFVLTLFFAVELIEFFLFAEKRVDSVNILWL